MMVELVQRLASNHREDALVLAGELFGLRRDQESEQWLPRIPAALYAQLLSTHCVLFSAALGLSFIDRLGRELDQVLVLDGIPGRDFSEVWSPDVADPKQIQIRGMLASAIVNGAREIISRGIGLESLLSALAERQSAWFMRFRLHLVTEAPASSATARLVGDTSLIARPELRREYRLALARHFGTLPAGVRRAILATLRTGIGGDGTAGSLARWQRDLLDSIRTHLEPGDVAILDALVEAHGPPSDPSQVVGGIRVMLGDQSPVDQDMLAQMDPAEVRAVLEGWQPKPSPFHQTPNGLGLALRRVLVEKDRAWSMHARLFIGLEPTYVRSFLEAVSDLVEKNSPVDWEPVLSLLEWLGEAAVPVGLDPIGYRGDRDLDWSFARRVAADLLAAGLSRDGSGLEIALAERVGNVLSGLLDDADPERFPIVGGITDPSVVACNSVRGCAFSTLAWYGEWQRRNGLQESGPDVVGQLFDRLQQSREASPAVWAAVGQNLSLWMGLVGGRSGQLLDLVLPVDNVRLPLWRAAWDAYLVSDRRWGVWRPELAVHYQRAIRDSSEPRRIGGATVGYKLAEHLIAFALCGDPAWDGAQKLLRDMFAVGPTYVRERAMECVGDWVLADEAPVAEVVVERAMALWDARRTCADVTDRELAAFGHWFSSGRLPAVWALVELRRVAEGVGRVDDEFGVTNRLLVMATDHGADVMGALRRLVEGTSEFFVSYMETTIVSILEVLRANTATRPEAIRMANVLLARGQQAFGALAQANQ